MRDVLPQWHVFICRIRLRLSNARSNCAPQSSCILWIVEGFIQSQPKTGLIVGRIRIVMDAENDLHLCNILHNRRIVLVVLL